MRTSVLILGTILFAAGMAMGVVLTGRLQTQSESQAAPASLTAPLEVSAGRVGAVASQPASRAGGDVYPDFTQIAEQSVAAVTNISSRQVVRQRSGFSNDPFFRYFFGDSQDLFGYRERPSLGSGVIVRDDGYILTNAHVVGRQTAGITVTLADNREYEADLVGRDEGTDIALLRIDARNLPTVPWGDSSVLRIAEWVLAVGNPFQLSQTVTLGIVSAVGRDNLGVARYEDFIQTDAAINPGNSGGPLINARGELIGVNTAIFSDTGGYQGVGFAVPSNLARRVMNELVDFGEVRRGSFGYVLVRPVTPQLAQELGVPDTRGAVVWTIHQASSAARAGMRPGDVIVAVGGTRVEDPADYDRLLSDASIGNSVTVGVIRGGEPISFDVLVTQARPR
jgi:Do/DeqQ family serine protease